MSKYLSDIETSKFLRKCDEMSGDRFSCFEDSFDPEDYKTFLPISLSDALKERRVLHYELKLLNLLDRVPGRFYDISKYIKGEGLQHDVNKSVLGDIANVVTDFRLSLPDAIQYALKKCEDGLHRNALDIFHYKEIYKMIFGTEYI